MSAAYWLSFALASIPYFAYLVGMTLSGLAFGRVNRPVPKGRGLPTWLLVLSSLAVFGFAGWQQTNLAFFFDPLPPPTGDFEEIVSREVFGVTVPTELGSAAYGVVSSGFWMLLMWVLAVVCLVTVFRPKPRGNLPHWGMNVLLVVFAGAFVWASWPYVGFVMRDWQRL